MGCCAMLTGLSNLYLVCARRTQSIWPVGVTWAGGVLQMAVMGGVAQAPYDETRDINSSEKCEAHSYISPPTSSDESASETSEE